MSEEGFVLHTSNGYQWVNRIGFVCVLLCGGVVVYGLQGDRAIFSTLKAFLQTKDVLAYPGAFLFCVGFCVEILLRGVGTFRRQPKWVMVVDLALHGNALFAFVVYLLLKVIL
jgi:hypothetical protein